MKIYQAKQDQYTELLMEMDDGTLKAQQLIQHGAIDAVKYLIENGVTLERAQGMLKSLKEQMSIVESISSERGVLLPIVD